jgi:acyl-CoA synthetase (AMP-forming)/AMP-acid ligase II
MRGPAVMRGYYNDPQATAEALRGGWLHTGDMGYRDEDGFYYHLDRRQDVIVRAGLTISSVEVENVLLQHPSVREAAVVAVPGSQRGEEIVAFVVPKAGHALDTHSLATFCAASSERICCSSCSTSHSRRGVYELTDLTTRNSRESRSSSPFVKGINIGIQHY